ncbi:MAG: hypothetical protein ACT4PV_09430 [Planctomycetaceae bacterium]
MIEPWEDVPAPLLRSGCRIFRMRTKGAGFHAGDLLLVLPDLQPEGGELVIDALGRVGRYGGGAVQGVVVGVVRRGAGAR